MPEIVRAERLEGWPEAIPRPRARKGPKALGIRYERRVGKALAGLPQVRRGLWAVEHGPWFRYWEAGGGAGGALCQPDFILAGAGGGAAFIIEVKYSWVPEAEEKLRGLYVPVAGKAGVAVAGHFTIVRALRGEIPARVVLELGAAMAMAEAGREPVVLHWCMGAIDGGAGG